MVASRIATHKPTSATPGAPQPRVVPCVGDERILPLPYLMLLPLLVPQVLLMISKVFGVFTLFHATMRWYCVALIKAFFAEKNIMFCLQ